MRITLNGAHHDTPHGTTVADLLAGLLPQPAATDGVAVARNDEVVPRSNHAQVVLAAGDVIEIVKAVQGG